MAQLVTCNLACLKMAGSCVCDQCPGEDEHVQNEVHALLICQDHRVCELRKHFSFLFSPFFEDFSAAQPFLLQQVNDQLVHDFLSQQNNRLFLFLSELNVNIQTPQVCVRFSFNFRHWLILFHQPIAISQRLGL